MSHNYLNKSRTQELINTIRGHLSDIATVLSNLASGDARDNTKAPINHTQPSSTITAMTGYSKPQSTSAITTADTLNEAIGKLEKGLEDAGGGGGDLAAHIAQHVEDTDGVHGIRCKDGALEVWNEYSQTWCDPSEIGWSIGNVSNLAITQGNLSLTITWTDPADTADATWAGTKLVMGAGTYPESVTDGTLLVNSTVRDAYSSTGYTVSNLTDGTTYYFKLFPYTDKGVITNDNANRISEQATIPRVGNVTNLAVTQGALSLTLTWNDPVDTALATWGGTKVLMKTGSYPTDINDGTVLANSTTRDAYATNGLTASNLTDGVTYYFKLFPYTTDGAITDSSANQISESARDLNSWEMVQAKVRANDMSDISIGDQYTCSQGSGELTWDVIGKNIDTPANPNLSHALTLRVHSLLPDNLVFDEEEAFYACQTSALSAGTYYYKSGSTNYKFTLTQSVPVGGQLVCTDNSTLYSYASGSSTTPIETVSVTSGSSGTNLGTLSNNTRSGNLNTDYRRQYGSNDWKESAIRQWLNSNKPAGQWWTPQNPWDRPPAYAKTLNGFLYDLDPDFLAVIGKTQVTTKYFDTSKDTINGTYTTEDYFFLMSTSQVSSNYSGEGTKYTPYSDNASRKMYKNGSSTSYWLRSPYSFHSSVVCGVNSGGSMGSYNAYGGGGVAPACNLI